MTRDLRWRRCAWDFHAPNGNGVIRGRVILVGNPPAAKTLAGSPMAKDETFVVGSANGLKNVIVFLKDVPARSEISAEPVVLDQVNCVFVPHVVAVEAGQALRIKSSDSLMHNAHLKCVMNPDANFGFAGPSQKDVVLNLPEVPFRVKCDVHPWMTAWVGVFSHPWFAVSGEDGSFTIEHVPPGDYTLAAWQEALPQQEQKIHVSGDKGTDVIFSFRSP